MYWSFVLYREFESERVRESAREKRVKWDGCCGRVAFSRVLQHSSLFYHWYRQNHRIYFILSSFISTSINFDVVCGICVTIYLGLGPYSVLNNNTQKYDQKSISIAFQSFLLFSNEYLIGVPTKTTTTTTASQTKLWIPIITVIADCLCLLNVVRLSALKQSTFP